MTPHEEKQQPEATLETAPEAPGPYVRTFTSGGREYTLDFDLKYLAEAELSCARQGHFVNLLFALNPATLNLNRLRHLFVGGLYRFHPEIPYEAAVEILQPENVFDFANTVWTVFIPKASA